MPLSTKCPVCGDSLQWTGLWAGEDKQIVQCTKGHAAFQDVRDGTFTPAQFIPGLGYVREGYAT